MVRHLRLHGRRGGFSLIELLVVMAIIAILAALTLAGVMKLLGKGPQTQAASDIRQLDMAIEDCKAKLHLPYIPSKMVLREDNDFSKITDPAKLAEAIKTKGLLEKAFGRACVEDGVQNDWNGNGSIDATTLELEGYECLVFWLGGIPRLSGGSYACTGFSTDVRYPSKQGGPRLGPYFDFKSSRLKDVTSVNGIGIPNGFPEYLDPYGHNVPYAYFSKRVGPSGDKYYPNDCSGLGVAPYMKDSINYLNPNGFQIICAGADGQFGTNNVYNPSTGMSGGLEADNHASFAKGLLAAGQ